MGTGGLYALAPRHHLFAAVVAVATDGDVGVGPVSADAPDQAAEQLANLHTRWRLAGTQIELRCLNSLSPFSS